MRLSKTIQFDSAHFLPDSVDAEPGTHPYQRVHGHSFTMTVTVAGEPDPETGWIVDFDDLTQALQALRERLDHRLLNDIEGLERPTLENLCLWAANQLAPVFPTLEEVEIGRPSMGERCRYHVIRENR